MGAWRHARAIALLPGTVALMVPAVILLTGEGPSVGWGLEPIPAGLVVALGLVLAAAGLALWAWTLRLLARIGEGTLAPWDPTRHLVVVGPYRHVRNPMISAVLAVLAGEAVALGSAGLAIWAGAFLAINHLFFLAHEEPALEDRFGEEYRVYRRHVPRWIPRRTPWEPTPRMHSPSD